MSSEGDMSTSDPAAADQVATVKAAFDSDFYLELYGDVASAGLDAWEHYAAIGWREGRDPTAWFSGSRYLAANPDVAAAGSNPFSHYILIGRDEGRPLALDQNASGTYQAATGSALAPVLAEFDASYYVAVNPDVELTAVEAFAHYLETGWREFRDPTRWFSTRRYLEANEDVAAIGVNPFVHYVLNGRGEGRSLEHDLGFRYDLVRNTDKFEPYIQALARFVPDKEPSPAVDLVELLNQLEAGRPFHLTISHDDYTATLGGVQLCLRIEGQAMRAAGANHVHLFPGAPSPVLDIQRDCPPLGVLIDGKLAGFFEPGVVASAMSHACRDRRVTLAIHSLIAHRVADLVAIADGLTIDKAYYWVHDFSSICANYALLRNDAVFCGPPPPQSLACEICVYGARRQIHLAHHSELFQAIDPVVIAPSQSALSVWRRGFPQPARRAVIHSHATLSPDRRRLRKASRVGAEPDAPLRVGFLGMPTIHKGWPVFAELVRRFADDPRYSFHHLAKETDRSIPTAWTRVEPTARKPAPMIDAVYELELDVALIWSLWPETFCFAAYEAVAGGAAILTNPDSGNVQDLIRNIGCGLVIEDDVFLNEIFASGDVMRFRRRNRAVRRQSLVYSRMTADLILGKTE